MRYKIIIEYNGKDFIGWQKNCQGASVQSTLEEAVYKLSQENTNFVAAGRTDSGVHAIAMPCHFDLNKEYSENTIKSALNFYLKNKDISVLDCKKVDDNFSARFSCLQRSYRYIVLNRKSPTILDTGFVWWIARDLDLDIMKKQSVKFLGKHDFTSFRAVECQAKSPIKTIDTFDINLKEENYNKYIYFDVSARSFLHHQVRNMVGTLVEIGLGKKMDIDEIFELKNRKFAGATAPAAGLYFVSAKY